MRKSILPTLTVSMLALASTFAMAADLPSRRAPPVFAPPPPIPVFTWTGFYAGANAGYAFDRRDTNSYYLPAGSVANASGTAGTLNVPGGRRNAFTGGGQIGYNYQFGAPSFIGGFGGGGLVLGVEADAQYIGFGRNNSNGNNFGFNANNPLTTGVFTPVAGAPVTVVRNSQREDFFGTVRGRLGVAIDRALIYGTGGFAYNTRSTGYAVGGGIEYAITNNITIRGEYLYVNLNRGTSYTASAVYPAGGPVVTLNTRGGRDNFSVARAALNYKFDMFAPMAPVVARY